MSDYESNKYVYIIWIYVHKKWNRIWKISYSFFLFEVNMKLKLMKLIRERNGPSAGKDENMLS